MSEYTIAFDKDSNVWKLYQSLKKAAVKDSDLDQGFEEVDYVRYTRSPKSRHDKTYRAGKEVKFNYQGKILGEVKAK